MKKVSEYRQHAEECRTLAANMLSQEQRDQLLSMAVTWDDLARERERSMGLAERATFQEPPLREG
jgi:hypothetical protein